MSTNNNNNSATRSVKVKPVQPRYINLMKIYTALNVYEPRVYLALRFKPITALNPPMFKLPLIN